MVSVDGVFLVDVDFIKLVVVIATVVFVAVEGHKHDVARALLVHRTYVFNFWKLA